MHVRLLDARACDYTIAATTKTETAAAPLLLLQHGRGGKSIVNITAMQPSPEELRMYAGAVGAVTLAAAAALGVAAHGATQQRRAAGWCAHEEDAAWRPLKIGRTIVVATLVVPQAALLAARSIRHLPARTSRR